MSSSGSLLGQLARDWRVKVAVQNALGLLPGDVGFRANEACIRFLRGHVDRTNTKFRTEKGISNLALIHNETGISFTDKTVLEIGTGWHGIDLLLFWLAGASKIFTIDHYGHLTLQSLRSHTPEVLSPWSLELISEFAPDARMRAERLNWKDWRNLDDALRELNVATFVSRSSLTKKLSIPDNSIDVVYSYSVIHRIPEHDLRLLLNDLAQRLMRTGGVCYHRTDQFDINTQRHLDPGHWRLAYLKYPDWLFDTFLSGRFNSQNRLRESDFIELLEQSGIEIVYKDHFIHEEDLERMKNFQVADRFKNKSIEDLATVRSTFIGRRGTR